MHAWGVKLLPTKVSCMQLRIQSGARETVAQSVFLRQNGCFPKSSHIYTVKSVTRTLFCPYLDAIVPKRTLKVFDDTTFLQCTCISQLCSCYICILTYFYANVLELIYSLVIAIYCSVFVCICRYNAINVTVGSRGVARPGVMVGPLGDHYFAATWFKAISHAIRQYSQNNI